MNLRKASKIDEETITPSDFTLFAENIPKDVTRKQIKQFLEERYKAEGIRDIIYCYNINTIVELLRKKVSQEKKLSYLNLYYKRILEEKEKEDSKEEDGKEDRQQKYTVQTNSFKVSQGSLDRNFIKPPLKGYCCFKRRGKTIKQRYQMIQDLDKQIKDYQELIENPDAEEEGEFCGKAFIIFNNQNEAIRIDEELHISSTKRILRYFWNRIL